MNETGPDRQLPTASHNGPLEMKTDRPRRAQMNVMSHRRRGDDKYGSFCGIYRRIITQNGSVPWFKANVPQLNASDGKSLKLENHTGQRNHLTRTSK